MLSVLYYCIVYYAQDGETALYYACWKGHSQIVALLAQASADMNQQNHVRCTVHTLYIRNKRGHALSVPGLLNVHHHP